MSAPPGCRILIRTDVDWDSMNRERFGAQSDPTRPLLFVRGATRRDLPGTFHRSFGVDYFRYRGELQRIARKSVYAVRDAVVTVGFDDFESWFYDDTDEFIFPIDDDDLFAPNLRQTIAGVDNGTAIVLWCHVMAGFVSFENVPAVMRMLPPILFSNNWGVRKSFLRTELGSGEAKMFLAHHNLAQAQALRIFRIPVDHLSPEIRKYCSLIHPRVVIHGDCYGVDYMHVGSLQFFGTLSNAGSAEKAYGRYVPEAEIPVPDFLGWARPYLDELRMVVPRLRSDCGARPVWADR